MNNTMRLLSLLLAFWAVNASAQANRGELRLSIMDTAGAALRARIELDSKVSHFRQSLKTDATGHLTFGMLPFGLYEISVEESGFSPYHAAVPIHSAIPQERQIRLALAGVKTEITVSDQSTLVDLHSTSSPSQIGSEQTDQRLSSLPGSSNQ